MLATANTGKIRRGFGKNAGEWTGRVERSEEEIPCSKRSMYRCVLANTCEQRCELFSVDKGVSYIVWVKM